MKKLLLTAAIITSGLFSCSKKETVVVEQAPFDNSQNEQRLKALEAAAQLNAANDSLLAVRVAALENRADETDSAILSIETEIKALSAQIELNNENTNKEIAKLRAETEASDEDLQKQIDKLVASNEALNVSLKLEISERIAAQKELQAELKSLKDYVDSSIAKLNADINTYVNQQLNLLDSKLTARILALEAATAAITNLTNRIASLELNSATKVELNAFKTLVNSTYATISMVNALDSRVTTLNSSVVTIQNQIVSLQSLISGLQSSQLSVLKVPCTNAKEVLFKIGSKVYADLNTSSLISILGIEVLGSSNSYLAELVAGTVYTSTDGFNCKFKVDASGNVSTH